MAAISAGRPTRPAGCCAWSLRRSFVAVVAGRHDPARTDAIDPHVGPEADRQRVGEGDQPALGGGIGFGVRFRHQRARGRDGDDGAFGGAQRPLGGARQQEGCGQIGVDDLAPFGERELPQRLAHHDAGVGDDRIEPAETIDDGSHRHPRGRFVRYVALDREDVALPGRERARQTDFGRSTAPIRQPSPWRRCAIARPMPRAAPVTIATRGGAMAMLLDSSSDATKRWPVPRYTFCYTATHDAVRNKTSGGRRLAFHLPVLCRHQPVAAPGDGAAAGFLRLSVRGLPYLDTGWVRANGLFEPKDEQVLAASRGCLRFYSSRPVLPAAWPAPSGAPMRHRRYWVNMAMILRLATTNLKRVIPCKKFVCVSSRLWRA